MYFLAIRSGSTIQVFIIEGCYNGRDGREENTVTLIVFHHCQIGNDQRSNSTWPSGAPSHQKDEGSGIRCIAIFEVMRHMTSCLDHQSCPISSVTKKDGMSPQTICSPVHRRRSGRTGTKLTFIWKRGRMFLGSARKQWEKRGKINVFIGNESEWRGAHDKEKQFGSNRFLYSW